MYQEEKANTKRFSNAIEEILKMCDGDFQKAKDYIVGCASKAEHSQAFEIVAPEVAAEFICLCIDIYSNEKGLKRVIV